MNSRYRNSSVLSLGGIVVLTLLLSLVVSRVPYEMSIALVIGVCVLVVSFLYAEAAIYILILSMLLSPEFGTRETSGEGATIRLEDILLVVVGCSWLARMAVHKDLGFFLKTEFNRPIRNYAMACILATGAGILYGDVKSPITGFFFVLKYIEYFVMFFMMVNHIESRRQVRSFLIVALITCSIVCFASLAQIPAGGRITAPFEGEGGEPNTLGGYLVLMLSLVLGLLFNMDDRDSKTYKRALLGLSFLCAVLILFTQSRGSWMAVGVMYVTLTVLSKRRLLLILGLLVVIPLSPVILPKAVKERVSYTFKKGESEQWRKMQRDVGGVTLDTSTSDRLGAWENTLKGFLRHPILGYGITGWRFLDAQFIKTLVETGLVGFTAFIALLVKILQVAWRTYKQTEDRMYKGICMGFFVGTVAMIAHGLFANTFIIVRIMEPYWLLGGLVVIIPILEAKANEASLETVAA